MDKKNNKGFLHLSLYFLIAVVSLGCLSGCAQDEAGMPDPDPAVNHKPLSEELQLADRLFTMELALNTEQRSRGLMGRESMADDEGMLFVFPASPPFPTEVSFWMKDCLIPIDVIFISREGQVISIHEMDPPLPGTPDSELATYPSGGPVQFAIELRGGLAAEIGLQVGDQIELRSEYLLELAE